MTRREDPKTKFLDIEELLKAPLPLKEPDPSVHHFDRESLHAINTALAAERPLLIRGEPGTGKTQLARAAAVALKRGFISRVVDAHTQVADLFYSFDAVSRLAEAQIAGPQSIEKECSVSELLDERRFVVPGPLWWAFAPERARKWLTTHRAQHPPQTNAPHPEAVLSEEQSRHGVVVLIDEIDKTDPSVPNGLLEALGQGTFPIPKERAVSLHEEGRKPLVVITTNEERELPSAFLRRCLVLHILVPKAREKFVQWLVGRGEAHFVTNDHHSERCRRENRELLSEKLLKRVAEQVYTDRQDADDEGLSKPGQAEYLDLLRALDRLRATNAERDALFREISDFALIKHTELYEKKRGHG